MPIFKEVKCDVCGKEFTGAFPLKRAVEGYEEAPWDGRILCVEHSAYNRFIKAEVIEKMDDISNLEGQRHKDGLTPGERHYVKESIGIEPTGEDIKPLVDFHISRDQYVTLAVRIAELIELRERETGMRFDRCWLRRLVEAML